MTPRRRGVHHARTDTPPANMVLKVWFVPEQREVEAVWDGAMWRSRCGEPLEPQPQYWYSA